MCVNRSLDRCVKGAHVSRIVNWGYRDNFKPVFFYKKILSIKNTHKQKPTNNKNKQTKKQQRGWLLCTRKLLKGWKSFVLHWGFLCVWNLFVKKNRFEIVSIASIHILLTGSSFRWPTMYIYVLSICCCEPRTYIYIQYVIFYQDHWFFKLKHLVTRIPFLFLKKAKIM